MTDALARLRAAGVSVWLDDLSRERLTSGSLAVLARDRGVSGVTTNPTIFARAITDSDAYADQIRDLWLRRASPDQALRELTASDVRWASGALRPVYDATGGLDGRVSIEVDPRIAHDTQRTVAEARALWWLVDRPNLFVKIPAARQGLPAISARLAEGISINVTLIFSLARYAEVIEAFLTGLEGARAAGRDLSGIASVASFFVSRVDTEVDRRLDKMGTERAGRIVLVAEEDIRPYERPPLSKEYLRGKADREAIVVHSPDWYDSHAVELLLGTTVTAIDRDRREVALSGGGRLGVLRSDVGKREFIAFWMSRGRVVAGMNVNAWDVTDAIQDLIRSGKAAGPDRLADPAVPLERPSPQARPSGRGYRPTGLERRVS